MLKSDPTERLEKGGGMCAEGVYKSDVVYIDRVFLLTGCFIVLSLV